MKLVQKKPNGFVILIAVIFLAAIGAVVSSSIVLLGLNSSLSNSVLESSFQASLLSNSCQEYAILRIKENNDYVGNETIDTTFGSCSIMPVVKNDNIYTLYTQAEYKGTNAKIKTIVTKDVDNNRLTINFKQQQADF